MLKKVIPGLICALLVLELLAGCTIIHMQDDAGTTAAQTQPGQTTLPTTQAGTTAPDETTETTVVTEPTELTEPTEETAPTETVPPETVPEETLPEDGPEDDELVLIKDYIPSIVIELAYATTNNFTDQRIYDFDDAYLRYGTVKKLWQVQQELAQLGLGLKLWDAFRPLSAQETLWEIYPDPTYVSHPETGNRSHCRGSAVDVTLIDLQTGEELVMPSGFDEFSDLGDRDYSDCSEEAAENAATLEQYMERYGFRPYSGEWWHFSDADDYPVEEFFEPQLPTVWYATCNNSMSLRRSASTSAATLARIYPNDELILLGWDRIFAWVEYNGIRGYVLANYIKPADSYFEEHTDTVEITATYTYEQMLEDLQTIQSQHPDLVTLGSIGQSELGRDLALICIGDLNAEHHVLIQCSIHAREHTCTWLIMMLIDYWVDHGIEEYGDVCFHIIPMANPDGVTISQTGVLPEELAGVYERDVSRGNTTLSLSRYLQRWKANGLGVDLNRNFDAGWSRIYGRRYPSSEEHKGTSAFCAAETVALRDYTLRYDFDATISYHATGSMIYYNYGNYTAVNRASLSLSRAVEQVTGYPSTSSSGTNPGGYKDWAIASLGIPSLTVEIGCEEAPLREREIYSIFVRNLQVLPQIARWVQENE